MYGTAFGQRVPEAQQEMIVHITDGALAQQVLELVQHEQQAGAGGETHDDGVRDVTREIAQPGQADGQLDGADHERHQDGELQPLCRVADRTNGAQQCDRNGVGRAVDELAR